MSLNIRFVVGRLLKLWCFPMLNNMFRFTPIISLKALLQCVELFHILFCCKQKVPFLFNKILFEWNNVVHNCKVKGKWSIFSIKKKKKILKVWHTSAFSSPESIFLHQSFAAIKAKFFEKYDSSSFADLQTEVFAHSGLITQAMPGWMECTGEHEFSYEVLILIRVRILYSAHCDCVECIFVVSLFFE